jgi:hypothetical protein
MSTNETTVVDPIGRQTALPDGYYATPDPADAETMTFWQIENGRFYPHTREAWYGPVPGADVDPDEDDELERRMQLGYSENRRMDWNRAVRASVEDDPIAARRCFVENSGRCTACGRPLKSGRSRLLGLGGRCFDRMPHELRMAYLAEIRRAQAERLGWADAAEES